MANFGYTSMKAAMQSNKRVGNWRDTPVYACTYDRLPDMSNDFFFIVFDDENALVKDGKRYGRVTASGDVRELDRPVEYAGFKRKKKEEKNVKAEYYYGSKTAAAATSIPAQATAAVGELEMNLAQIEVDIQNTLNGIKMDDIFKELEKFDFGI